LFYVKNGFIHKGLINKVPKISKPVPSILLVERRAE